MLLTPLLFLIYDRARLPRLAAGRARAADEIDEQGAVIIAGMGRFGQAVNRLLAGLGHKTVVLDSHAEHRGPDAPARHRGLLRRRRRGWSCWRAAGLGEAQALVIAIDDPEKTLRMVRQVRRRHPRIAIIARARDRRHVYALHNAGATETVREVFDGAVHAGEYALAALGYGDGEIARIASDFFEHDRRMLTELAPLWRPDLPEDQNQAYIAKEREQYAAIAGALRGRGRAVPADLDDPAVSSLPTARPVGAKTEAHAPPVLR